MNRFTLWHNVRVILALINVIDDEKQMLKLCNSDQGSQKFTFGFLLVMWMSSWFFSCTWFLLVLVGQHKHVWGKFKTCLWGFSFFFLGFRTFYGFLLNFWDFALWMSLSFFFLISHSLIFLAFLICFDWSLNLYILFFFLFFFH
jgi:hypothetical protein